MLLDVSYQRIRGYVTLSYLFVLETILECIETDGNMLDVVVVRHVATCSIVEV